MYAVKRHVLSMSVQRHGTMVRQAWPVPVISKITNEVLDYIYATHGHRIQQWNLEYYSLDPGIWNTTPM